VEEEANMSEEMFEGSGGLKIFTRSWRPEGAPRGIVVLVHGLMSHSGLYEWPATELAQRGLAVHALDLRGHGRSEGERLYVNKFGDYVGDVAKLVAIAKAKDPGLPTFVLGHSAGGVIACIYMLEHQQDVSGLICESFAHEVPAPDFALAIIKGLSHVAPHAHVLKLKAEDFSRDPDFVTQMRNDPLIPKLAYPSQTVAEMVRADERLKTDFPLIMIPVFILHGTADRVTKPHGSERFYDSARSTDKTLKLYEGYFHDLLHDVGKERVMADVTEWITTRTAPR
jgi:alpha-beta hydrolase superfamily lysophospholipase